MQKKLSLFLVLPFFINLSFVICQDSKSQNNSITINLEIPKCKKNALIITNENKDLFLETQKKEDTHQIITHSGFTLCYREKFEIPEWVAYTLTKEKLEKNVKRKDNFRIDDFVFTDSSQNLDYKKSGFDKGHLAPSGDLTYSFDSMNDSFYLSNMTPQVPGFNRGIWKTLETQVREFAQHFDIIYIVTGPILEKSKYKTIGQNQVAIPEYFYKAILAKKDDNYFAIGFIMPNKKCVINIDGTFIEDSIWNYATTIDKIEERTKIDFFYALDDNIENEIEKYLNIEDFKIEYSTTN